MRAMELLISLGLTVYNVAIAYQIDVNSTIALTKELPTLNSREINRGLGFANWTGASYQNLVAD